MNLFLSGLNGDSVTDEALVIKSHFPLPFDNRQQLHVNKAIVCYRQPLDSILSLYNLYVTLCHDRKVSLEFFQKNCNLWNDFVEEITERYQEWYNYWITAAKEKKLPVHFVKFDDFIHKKQEVIE
jgi:hypothetical protein